MDWWSSVRWDNRLTDFDPKRGRFRERAETDGVEQDLLETRSGLVELHSDSRVKCLAFIHVITLGISSLDRPDNVSFARFKWTSWGW